MTENTHNGFTDDRKNNELTKVRNGPTYDRQNISLNYVWNRPTDSKKLTLNVFNEPTNDKISFNYVYDRHIYTCKSETITKGCY